MNLAWLVAIIEPRLLFGYNHSGRSQMTPEAELARAMQGHVIRSPFDDDLEDTSVRAICDAFQGDEGAVDTLVQCLSTAEVRGDLAKFTATTLVACALLAERDDTAKCLQIISNVLDMPADESPSTDLCMALALQQRALRQNDIGESTEYDLREVRRLIDRNEHSSYPSFALQVDLHISSHSAVENIRSALRSSAAGFELNTKPPTTISQVNSDLEGDQLVQFRRWLDSTFRKQIGGSLPVDHGQDLYFENLRLEVLAHRTVYRSRRELAMMRIIRFTPALPSGVAADSLRLLRLAGADSDLRLLVNDLILAGPISPLLVEGRRICMQRTSEKSLRTGEVIILAAAAEMMAPAEAFQTLTRVLSVIRKGGPSTAPLHWQADFSKDEEAWVAAAALAGAAGSAGVVARDLLEYATSDRLADIAFDTVVARILRTLEWADIDEELRASWHHLGIAQAADHPSSPTVAAIRWALKTGSELTTAYTDASQNQLADNINHYLLIGQAIPGNLVQAAKSAGLSNLRQVAAEASKGTLTRRVTRPAEIIAVLLTQSTDEDTWRGLLEFLADPAIARSEKSRAFDILVRERPPLASEIASQYAKSIESLILRPDRWAFDASQHQAVFVSALSFAYAYGFLSEETTADHFRRLAASNDASTRRQAAHALSLLASSTMDDWMLTKVYALSTDRDPTVSVAAARALCEICLRHDAFGEIAVDRLCDSLLSGGLYVPLQTLTRLTPQVINQPRIDQIVRQLRNDSPSWRIRKHAARLTR